MGSSCLYLCIFKPNPISSRNQNLFSSLSHHPSCLETMDSVQSWVSKHKLASIGTLWASTVGASLAYNARRSPLKPSLRLIHARIHGQALTLAVLCGAAIKHYYDVEN